MMSTHTHSQNQTLITIDLSMKHYPKLVSCVIEGLLLYSESSSFQKLLCTLNGINPLLVCLV